MTVNVPPPDGVQMPDPAFIIVPPAPVDLKPPPAASVALFAFPITCKGYIIGNGSAITSVKENVTNHKVGPQQLQDDILVGDGDKLYVTGTTVFDKKYNRVGIMPNNLGVFETYDQEIVVYISDSCGGSTPYPLKKFQVSAATMIDPNGNPKLKISVGQ